MHVISSTTVSERPGRKKHAEDEAGGGRERPQPRSGNDQVFHVRRASTAFGAKDEEPDANRLAWTSLKKKGH